ncbi:winged helix-turn-helix domain-containing protein [Colwellia ponticola]|uniref:Winged helix-turn-helix domain-containing protein n=1 Tax=Colwellia ponticola TaxID=2304625 RepID=A0A8H2PJH9_9GAMM|nr:helix-turn-helix domain-containing protein [Colwellia ponticola]TMM41897.1 winged helix-turn-helix domain-containing protein [Colwellia ponticola]
MRYFQSDHSMLIISNDSFIAGLLTGYCVANHFTLKCIPHYKPLDNGGENPDVNLIILDLRDLTTSLIEQHLQSLNTIHSQYSIPICAIHNKSPMPLYLTLPWINYYNEDSFIEKLDEYISKHIIDLKKLFEERRSLNRRVGGDRRTLLKNIDTFSSKQVNNRVQLPNRNINIELLGLFEIERDCQNVYLKGVNLELTTKEFKLFTLLAEAPKRVCTTEQLITNLWPNRSRANKSDLYQYMHLLRKKVERDPDNPYWIKTIKGVGYKLHI